MTTGSHHMQVYWLPAAGPDRRVEPLPWVWILDDQRWIPADSSFLKPPMKSKDRETGRWNQDCIRCHATHGIPQITDTGVHTTVGELGIACEACHGPGREHLSANTNPARRYLEHLGSDDGDETIVNPQRLDYVRSTQVCGNCHSLAVFQKPEDMTAWMTQGYRFRPCDDLQEVRHLLQVDYDDPVVERVLADQPHVLEDHFWSDGMIRVGGREYAGLIRSPCHIRGTLSCVSCHRMHMDSADDRPLEEWLDDQLDPDAVGDGACVDCHALEARQGEAHTHHPAGSTGAACDSCHMPHTTWGLLKGIRQHELDSPSTAASLETGRPNACNLCHLDKTLAWTSEHLEAWTGQVQPELTDKEKNADLRRLQDAGLIRREGRGRSTRYAATPSLRDLVAAPEN
jgi:formate-dependent nitrite reductase cytochrome c552 subunit